MSEEHAPETHKITNPFQATAFIFFKPKAVFDILFSRDNWSWVPFLMLTVVLFMPGFLFFKVVDFDYWINIFVQLQLPEGSPKEHANMAAPYFASQMQYTYALMGAISPLIMNLVLAAYYSITTRNDDKCIQGYTDWFGAMWWCAMPALLAGLFSILLISLYAPNVQTFDGAFAPLSIAFFVGIDPLSPWSEILKLIRIDAIWSVYLGFVLLTSWTEFSKPKAIATALSPYLLVIVLTAISALLF